MAGERFTQGGAAVRQVIEQVCGSGQLGMLVRGEGVAARVTDSVDPGVIAGGVDPVRVAAAGQRHVGALGRGRRRRGEQAVVDGGALGRVDGALVAVVDVLPDIGGGQDHIRPVGAVLRVHPDRDAVAVSAGDAAGHAVAHRRRAIAGLWQAGVVAAQDDLVADRQPDLAAIVGRPVDV